MPKRAAWRLGAPGRPAVPTTGMTQRWSASRPAYGTWPGARGSNRPDSARTRPRALWLPRIVTSSAPLPSRSGRSRRQCCRRRIRAAQTITAHPAGGRIQRGSGAKPRLTGAVPSAPALPSETTGRLNCRSSTSEGPAAAGRRRSEPGTWPHISSQVCFGRTGPGHLIGHFHRASDQQPLAFSLLCARGSSPEAHVCTLGTACGQRVEQGARCDYRRPSRCCWSRHAKSGQYRLRAAQLHTAADEARCPEPCPARHLQTCKARRQVFHSPCGKLVDGRDPSPDRPDEW